MWCSIPRERAARAARAQLLDVTAVISRDLSRDLCRDLCDDCGEPVMARTEL